jgi:lipopolysaccharide transport system permease protein
MLVKEEIIRPQKGLSLNLKELWQYRELFYFFTWRDIKVKYKQAFLGFIWVILQPLLTMFIFTFLGIILKIPSEGVPYPIFAFSGLMFWTLFSSSVSTAGNSMVSNSAIIKKLYFPRLIIPISSILVAAFDFLIGFLVYIGLIIYFGMNVSVFKIIVFIPISLLLTVVSSFGIGSLLAALNVKYRDVRYIIPFFIQSLMFLTPVIYPVTLFQSTWAKYLMAINPMTGTIELARNAILDKPLDYPTLLISTVSAITFFFLGLIYFKKTEYYFADIA